MKNIGENIRKARLYKGFSQKYLSELLGVNMQTVWRWENNTRTPRVAELQKLAEIFDTSISHLTRDETDNDVASEKPKSSSNDLQSACQHTVLLQNDELPPNVKKIRGKTYMDGVALDTLAHQLRDRLIIELFENDEKTREEIRDTLHDCLRLYTDHEVSHKTA